MTRISVIIPTWNRAVETERAIQSVVNQTYHDIEIIVADDGSSDSTPSRFYNHPDPRVHYLRLDHSGLPAIARNAALYQAQGEYAAFLDSDDEWLPEKLERQLGFLNKNPGFGMVCTNARIRHEKSPGSASLFFPETIAAQEWPLKELVKANIIITSSMLTNRQSVIAVGGFPQDPIYRAIEDYALWLRLAVKTRLYYLAEPLVVYTDAENSIRSLQKQEDQLKGLMRIFDELIIDLEPDTTAIKKNVNNRRFRCLKSLLKIAISNGKIKDSLYYANRILALELGNIARIARAID